MAQPDKLPVGGMVVTGVIFAVFLFFSVMAMEILVQWWRTNDDQIKIYGPQAIHTRALKDADRARIQGYKWIDKNAGVVQLDIERAKELVVERVAAGNN